MAEQPQPLAPLALAVQLLPQLPQPPLPQVLPACLMWQWALPARRLLTRLSVAQTQQRLQPLEPLQQRPLEWGRRAIAEMRVRLWLTPLPQELQPMLQHPRVMLPRLRVVTAVAVPAEKSFAPSCTN